MDRDKMSNLYRGPNFLTRICFLPRFSSFGLGVSDEKIKIENLLVYGNMIFPKKECKIVMSLALKIE
jgi:hypothetical protein